MPQFHCPHCGQHIDAGDEFAGMAATCPSCNNEILVPGGEGEVEYQTPAEGMQAEYPAEAEPEQAQADAYAQPPPQAHAPLPPVVPNTPPVGVPRPVPYHAPPGHPTSGFAADYAQRTRPRVGFAHWILVVMASIVVAGIGLVDGYVLSQPEPGVHVSDAAITGVATGWTIGFFLLVFVITCALSVFTALLLMLFKKPFWRNFLTCYGIYAILVAATFGALFWTMKEVPGFKFFHRPVVAPEPAAK